MCDNKGEYLGTCNMSKCETKLPANWYNWGSLSWYCEYCAKRLNFDLVNEHWAYKNLGHKMLTEGQRLYTLGTLDTYEPLFENGKDTPYKLGRSDNYSGGIVFETIHQVNAYIARLPNVRTTSYGIYFVLCGIDNTYTKEGQLHLVNHAVLQKLK